MAEQREGDPGYEDGVQQPTLKHPRTGPGDRLVGPSAPVDLAALGAAETVDVDSALLPELDSKHRRGDVLPAGEQLGRYRVVDQLGSGGMGAVLRVVDPAIGREVAAKIILGEASPLQLDRFALEAQITGQLEHPNIVPVHEFGQTEGKRLYFTMKRVDGVALDQLINAMRAGRRDLPLSERVQILIKVCDAVAFAHSRGVVHRDIKPANVMVGAFGEVQLMDWGLAKVLDQGEDESSPARRLMLATSPGETLDGAIKGTPAYMSPEQALGEVTQIGARSDIYSIGALLYELLTLRPPFEGGVAQVLDQVAAGQLVKPSIRAREFGQIVPWELEALILKAMSIEPDGRYASAEALRADLSGFLGGQLLAAADYTTGQWFRNWLARHRVGAAVVLSVLLVVGLAVVAQQIQRREAKRTRRAEVARKVSALLVDADARLALIKPAALGAAFERARVDGPPLRSPWRESMVQLLNLAGKLDRGLMLERGSAVLLGRRRATGRRLARAATLSGDFTLAAQVAADLSRFGVADTEVSALQVAISDAKTARLRRRREAIEGLVEEVGQGLSSARRRRATWTFDDYVFAAVGYRDAQSVGVLREFLTGIAEKQRQAQRRRVAVNWSEGERDQIVFCAAVLVRLIDERGALAELIQLFERLDDPELLGTVGIALCNTRRAEAYWPLISLAKRSGATSSAWESIVPHLHKVPESKEKPPSGGAEALSHGEFLRTRQVIRMRQGRWKLALIDSEAIFELGQPEQQDWMRRGLTLSGLQRPSEGLLAFNKAMAMGQPDVELLSSRARALSALKRFREALADLNHALGISPLARLFFNRSLLYAEMGQLERALEDLVEAERRGASGDPRLHKHRGAVLFGLGRVQDGLVAVSHGLAFNPKDTEALALRAAFQMRLGRLAAAAVDVQRALELDPNNPRALEVRVQLRLARGALSAAREDGARLLRLAPRLALTWLSQALIQQAMRQFDQALKSLDRAQRLCRTALAAYQVEVVRGDVYRRMRRFADALAAYRRALALVPDGLEASINRAIARYESGDIKGAIADARRAVARTPDHADAQLNLGQLLFAAGSLDEARLALDRAVGLAQHNFNGWHYRALVRARQGDKAGAIADYGRALKINAQHVPSLINRGDMLLKAGQAEASHRDMVSATQAAPQLWQAWAGLSNAAVKLGRLPEAIDALRRAIALAPTAVAPGLKASLKRIGG